MGFTASGNRKARGARACGAATAATAAALVALTLAVPEPAHAIGLLEVFAWGPVNVICYLLSTLVYGLMSAILLPIADVAFSWSVDYISIPGVGKAILLFQMIALFAVVAIRIAIGVKDNILLSGGSREASLGEYLFKSVASIALVALMPMLCRTIFYFGRLVFTDVLGQTDTITAELNEYFGPGGIVSAIAGDGSEDVWKELNFDGVWQVVSMVLTGLVLTLLVVAVGYQFLRRQIEMVVISLVAPLVSIYSATENDSYMVKSLLTRSLGLALTMTVQYILVRVAIGFGETFLTSMCGESTLVATGGAFTAALNFKTCAPSFILAIAALGCALSVPGIVNEYTTPTGNGQAGNMAMMLVRSMALNGARGAGRDAVAGAKDAMGAGKAAFGAAAGAAAATAGGPLAGALKGAMAGVKAGAKGTADAVRGGKAGGAGAATGAGGTADARADGASGAQGERAERARDITGAAGGTGTRGGAGSQRGAAGGATGWNQPSGWQGEGTGGQGAAGRAPSKPNAGSRPGVAERPEAAARVADITSAARGGDGRKG